MAAIDDMMKNYLCYCEYYFLKVVRNIFSVYKWAVFLKPIKNEALVNSLENINDTPNLWCRRAESSDYEDLVGIYPKEFSETWPEKVKKKKLFSRKERNIPCFLVGEGGEILGATWCTPVKEIPCHLFGELQGRCFEMVNTFVVPKARKRGLGQALRLYAISCMAEEGFRNAISYVWYSRRDSIKMNLQSGSLLVAEKRQITVLGRQMKVFSPYVRLDKLPLGCAMPTLVLLGYNFKRLKGIAKAFAKFGVPVKPVALQSLISTNRWSLVRSRYSVDALIALLDRLNRERPAKTLVLYTDQLETEHALELEQALDGLANPINSSSAVPDLGTLVIEAERSNKPVADSLYMNAIGEGGKIVDRG